MMITLIGIVVGMLAILFLMYVFIGLAMTVSLRRGIRKIWNEDPELRDHNIFWYGYLLVTICWPLVDWDNVEYQNNWAISIEMGEKDHETT